MRFVDNDDAMRELDVIENGNFTVEERREKAHEFIECMNVGGIYPREIQERLAYIMKKFKL